MEKTIAQIYANEIWSKYLKAQVRASHKKANEAVEALVQDFEQRNCNHEWRTTNGTIGFSHQVCIICKDKRAAP